MESKLRADLTCCLVMQSDSEVEVEMDKHLEPHPISQPDKLAARQPDVSTYRT